MLSVLDNDAPFEFRSYEQQSISKRTQRIDNSEEPGEHSFDDWWIRAQHSWHDGSGQVIFDSPESSRFAFDTSIGLDIWTDNEIGLLPDTFSIENSGDDNYVLHADGGYLFIGRGTGIGRTTDPDTPTVTFDTLGGSGNVEDLTSDGKYLYACWGGSAGIRREEMAAGTWGASDTLVNDLDPTMIEFLKGRLMCAKGRAIYEITDLTSTTEPSALYTHASEGWLWTDFADSGPAIYASGYAGNRSEIYAIRLDASDLAAGATLGAPRSVWEAPRGEVIYAIHGYLGKAMLIGTSAGIRQAIVSTGEGDLDVSPILAYSDQPVKAIDIDGDFAWFALSRYDSLETGVGRIHLGNLAWATDLMYAENADVSSIARYGGRTFFSFITADSGRDSRAIGEHLTRLAPSGEFTTGEIRWGTFERKNIRFLDLMFFGGGIMSGEISRDDGAFIAFTTPLSEGAAEDSDQIYKGILPSEAESIGTRFNLKLIFTRDAGDDTSGPTLQEWRLRGEPKITGRVRYFVPLQLFDFMQDLNDRQFGHPGYGAELLAGLTTLYRDGTIFEYQDPASYLTSNTFAVDVFIEDLRFKSYTPPVAKKQGIGGHALVILREQA